MISPPATVQVLLCLVLAMMSGSRNLQAEPTPSILQQLNDGLISVYEKASPSVVIIDVTKKTTAPDPATNVPKVLDKLFKRHRATPVEVPPLIPETEGSGVILREDGYIVTNSHVVQDAATINVRLKDGTSHAATLIGSDVSTDIAVVKVEATGLPAATLADSDKLKVGQLVCAIGTPYNLDYTFTQGVVSALGRSNLQQVDYEEYIQTDVSINPGNSGGPLCDIDGRVVGINTLINGINRGLSFSIPINLVRDIAEKLITSGRVIRPWLGIRIQSLSVTLSKEPSLRKHFEGIESGVVIETIEPDTPALRSNLRPADVIIKVDGVNVSSARELQKEVLKKRVGEEVELTIWRNSKTLICRLKTAELPPPPENVAGLEFDREPVQPPEVDVFGLSVAELTPEISSRLGFKLKSGLLVTDVLVDSPAAEAGILPQDVVTEVDAVTVVSVEEFREALRNMQLERGALLHIDRHGEKTFALLNPRPMEGSESAE